MTTSVAALVVRPDGTASIEEVVPDLEGLKAVVGGWLEMIRPPYPSTAFGDWHAYVDENGGYNAAALPNPAATEFARSIGWASTQILVGPVIFLGSALDSDGEPSEEGDVPPEVVGAAVRVWGLEA